MTRKEMKALKIGDRVLRLANARIYVVSSVHCGRPIFRMAAASSLELDRSKCEHLEIALEGHEITSDKRRQPARSSEL